MKERRTRATSHAPGVSLEERDAIIPFLNPHLLDLLTLEARHEVRRAQAAELLTPQRLDVMAKYLYAADRARGLASAWAEYVYREHLRVWNGFQEGDGSGKASFEDYLECFDRLLKGMQASGFDRRDGLVPVGRGDVLIDGGHRLAAALALGASLDVVRIDHCAAAYDYSHFARLGLDPDALDDMALKYCILDRRVRVAVVFPVAQGHDERVAAVLERCGETVCRKSVSLSTQGRANLVRLLYAGEGWVGDGISPTYGLLQHVNQRFAGQTPVRFVFLCARPGEDLAAAKAEIRALFGKGNDPIHINDTHEQSIAIAQAILNRNGLHHLNHARPRRTPTFDSALEQLNAWIADAKLDPGRFCVDGSAVLAAYGVRDANDLDFLYWGDSPPQPPGPLLGCHNGELEHFDAGLESLVADPRNYFYFRGRKFLALPRLRAMKAHRDEPKDRSDVFCIDSLQGRMGLREKAYGWYFSLPGRLALARHRATRAVAARVPRPLLPVAKRIYELPRVLKEAFGPGVRECRYRGYRLVYSRRTSLVDEIRGGRIYEPAVSRALARALQAVANPVYIDVGANIGLVSLNVLADVPGTTIFAFEPGAHQARLLRETVRRNGMAGNLRVVERALGRTAGTALFAVHSSRHASGDGFIDTGRAGRTVQVQVEVTTLDDWWDAAGSPCVHALKIDTEGAELWVLEGADRMLAACRPTIVFELHPVNLAAYPHGARDVVRHLVSRRYRVRTLAGDEVSEETVERYLSTDNDFLAKPEP